MNTNTFRHFKQTSKQNRNSTQCVPRRRIGFLKIMKCAGTSVQNLLLRYSMKHNLNIVLPGGKTHGTKELELDYSVQNLDGIEVEPKFSRKMIKGTVWEKARLNYHMFFLHTLWDHHEISNVLNDQGKGEVFYFSIIREPLILYRSYWDYFILSKKFDKTLDEYAMTIISKHVYHNNVTHCLPGYNLMLSYFGMYCHDMIKQDMSRAKPKEYVQKKVDEIAETFDLILLADEDHYDDGMVLLKDALCWEYEDIINVKRNVAPLSQHSNISEEAKAIIKGN